jgi:phage gp46-like protein
MSTVLEVLSQTVNAPNLLWDTTWDGFVGDWAPDLTPGAYVGEPPFGNAWAAPPFQAWNAPWAAQWAAETEPTPTQVINGSMLSGGFRARAPLQTAILLCLMSDRRAEANDFIPDGSGDPRGWAGDGIDPTIAPLGSRLWLLRRSILTPEVEQLAEIYAQEALQTLIDQGAVAAFDISATAALAEGQLRLRVKAYEQDGTLVASLNFSLMWQASNGVLFPLAP